MALTLAQANAVSRDQIAAGVGQVFTMNSFVLDRLAFEMNYVDLGTAEAPLALACPAIAGFPCPSEASIDASAGVATNRAAMTRPLAMISGAPAHSHGVGTSANSRMPSRVAHTRLV